MITVRGRELIIPEIERQIGTPYDSCAETRQIKINRQTVGEIDISHLDFRLDLRYGNEVHPDTDILGKEVTEDSILLTWTVKAASVAQVGTVWIAVRGSDDFGTVKWATNEGALYVGRTINTPGDQDLPLTELELLEKRIDQKSEDLDAAENSRVEAEKIRVENENKRLQNEAEWQIQGEAAVEAAQTASEAAQTATTKAGEAAGSAATAEAAAERAEAAAGIDGTAGSVKATDVEGLVGEAGNQSDVQALLNEIAKRVVKEMVTSDTFQTQLARYLVNNALTTEIGKFALDAAFGKNIQDQIDQLNSNITGISNNLDDIQKALNPVKSTVVDNADTNILNSVNLVVWGPESYSTPYKTGNTVYGNGFCITYSTGDQWLCQLAMAVGDSNLFTRHRRLGVWSGWTTK